MDKATDTLKITLPLHYLYITFLVLKKNQNVIGLDTNDKAMALQ